LHVLRGPKKKKEDKCSIKESGDAGEGGRRGGSQRVNHRVLISRGEKEGISKKR